MYKNIDRESVEKSYEIAKKRYADFGIDTDAAIDAVAEVPISVHCWQGDDVTGFEGLDGLSGGGIMATGNYPGKPRTPDELRQDINKAFSLIPGKKKLNLHAIYAEFDGKKVDRDQLRPEHFSNWLNWAKEQKVGLDFNPSYFSHELADTGFTLSSKDEKVRRFWIDHGKRSREIAAHFGKELGSPCVNNVWIPDGYKDFPADRKAHREILKDSLDELFAESFPKDQLVDAVESKLFGIGSEAYVVGSAEFYLAFAISRNLCLCMDAGHYHPTETIADKISSVLTFLDSVLLHVSRPMRWDSDHVVLFDDETRNIALEIQRAEAFNRVYIALDFFDASINRIGAWVTGTRASAKAILSAMLEPTNMLKDAEEKSDFGLRLALTEEFKTLPFAAVWDKYCVDQNVPVGAEWLNDIAEYAASEFSKRS